MMLLFLSLLFVLCFYKLQIVPENNEYMSVSTTTSVKGVFIVLVMLSHAKSYCTLGSNVGDVAYDFVIRTIGQLMVAMFLFYSGFGIIESYKNKPDYAKGFAKKRILKTLLHFDIAVLLFAIMNICLNITYSPIEWGLCWMGWESIGNSNWFIFVILACYIVVWISFVIAERYKKQIVFICMCTLIGVCLIACLLYVSGKGSWWYNTILCFPCGMFFSEFRLTFEKILRNRGGVFALYTNRRDRFCCSLYGG